MVRHLGRQSWRSGMVSALVHYPHVPEEKERRCRTRELPKCASCCWSSVPSYWGWWVPSLPASCSTRPEPESSEGGQGFAPRPLLLALPRLRDTLQSGAPWPGSCSEDTFRSAGGITGGFGASNDHRDLHDCHRRDRARISRRA